MTTKKEVLKKFYEMWLERLVAAEIDFRNYQKLPDKEVIDEVKDKYNLGGTGLPIKRGILAGELREEAEKRRVVAQRFVDTIREMLEEEEKKSSDPNL
jgi:hypothetical protein